MLTGRGVLFHLLPREERSLKAKKNVKGMTELPMGMSGAINNRRGGGCLFYVRLIVQMSIHIATGHTKRKTSLFENINNPSMVIP